MSDELPTVDPRDIELRSHRIREARVPLDAGMSSRVAYGQLDSTVALESARVWCRGPPGALILLGPPGTGKTVAAAWLISRVPYSRYVKARELVRLSMAAFGDDHEAYTALRGAPLLVIDDLGTERDKVRGKEALHDVIDERMSRRTVLISNESKSKIFGPAGYDARTVDRLRAIGKVIPCGGPSLREGEL